MLAYDKYKRGNNGSQRREKKAIKKEEPIITEPHDNTRFNN